MSRRFEGPRLAHSISDLVCPAAVDDVCRRLEADGYLETFLPVGREVLWKTTILGNALAMASFGKPISRATADRHIREIVERARAYNADPNHTLFWVGRLRVFGSYLDPSVAELGDVDIEVTVGSRDHTSEQALAYSKESGRTFSSYMDELFWPKRELLRILKNRSTAINLTEEDVEVFTRRVETIFQRAQSQ